MTTLQITPHTIVADLLNAYPLLEDKLIEIAPVFKKLKNPVLRRTIAKVTSLKQAAVVGNVQLAVLINELRKATGEEEMPEEIIITDQKVTDRPSWACVSKANVIYDAQTDLENGVHPLAKVMKDASGLNEGEIYLLLTPFAPAPLIDKLRQKGYEVYTGVIAPLQYGTFVKPKSKLF